MLFVAALLLAGLRLGLFCGFIVFLMDCFLHGLGALRRIGGSGRRGPRGLRERGRQVRVGRRLIRFGALPPRLRGPIREQAHADEEFLIPIHLHRRHGRSGSALISVLGAIISPARNAGVLDPSVTSVSISALHPMLENCAIENPVPN